MKAVNQPIRKKRCHGAGDRKTGFYGRSGSEGLS